MKILKSITLTSLALLPFQIASAQVVETCNGDGGDQMGCTDCPCGNNAPQGTIGGCRNSNGTSARLLASGTADPSSDSLEFTLIDAPPFQPCFLIAGDNVAPATPGTSCFGTGTGVTVSNTDGLVCVQGNEIRTFLRLADANGDVGITNNGWSGLIAFGAFGTGQTRVFQGVTRDIFHGGCLSLTNTTNALVVTLNGMTACTGMNCDDGDPNTLDGCVNGVCTHEAICSGSQVCTGDFCYNWENCVSASGCVHTITGFDQVGDGWNGASLQVFVDSVPFVNGFTIGGFTDSTSFQADDGDIIDTIWTSGPFDNEITYRIHDGGGFLLATDGPSPAGLSGLIANCDAFSEGCFGDGGDQLGCTDCPCNNNASPGSGGGCKHSFSDALFGGAGAHLIPLGSTSLSAMNMCFEMERAKPNSFAVLTSGEFPAPANAANPCFAQNPGSGIQSSLLDGLRCVVQGVLRHGARAVDAAGYTGINGIGPEGRWGFCSPNFPNSAMFTAGTTRHFQAIYREDDGAVCDTEQNTTQRVSLIFEP